MTQICKMQTATMKAKDQEGITTTVADSTTIATMAIIRLNKESRQKMIL